MRRAFMMLPLLAMPGTAWGDDGAADPRLHEISRARAAAIAAEGSKLPLVDPIAPVPMEIRTSGKPGMGASAAEPLGCVLPRDGSSKLTSQQCTGCHASAVHATVSHQVEIPYETPLSRGRGRVRPQEEAVRRGAFLPEGKVRCTSCHDGKSRLRYRLAISGAELRPAVKLSSPTTFEPGLRNAPPLVVTEGFEAAVKPLCLKCHPME